MRGAPGLALFETWGFFLVELISAIRSPVAAALSSDPASSVSEFACLDHD
jgi:hypothetical protein